MSINRMIHSLRYINNLKAIKDCKIEAIKLKNENYFENIPGQLALIDQIIEFPKKHYKDCQRHNNMFSYFEYLIYNDQAVS